MADKTGISWTDATWSPVAGCNRVSEGCRNCYAERLVATRLRHTKKYAGLAQMTVNGPRWTNVVRCVEDALLQPLSWKKPRRIFVNSMSDTFHKDVPYEFLAAMFGVMAVAKQHTFQLLTKRPENAVAFFNRVTGSDMLLALRRLDVFAQRDVTGHDPWLWPLPNVWIGTSVEDQAAADARIPHLLKIPAAVRFLSCEPLLGPVDLTQVGAEDTGGGYRLDALTGEERYCGTIRRGIYGRVHWVITGGESGPGARPMNPDWARSLRDQCQAAGVAFHHKQNGEWAPGEIVGSLDEWHAWEAAWMNWAGVSYTRKVTPSEDFHADDQPDVYRIGAAKAGRWLDGVTHDAFPEARVA